MKLEGHRTPFTEKSVFISLALSYFVIAVIFIISLLSSYGNSSAILREEIKDKNVHLLNQIQTGMDGVINETGNLANQILMNENIMSFIGRSNISGGDTQYLITRISDVLKNYRAMYGNTADIFIYSAANDYILSSKVCNNTRDFHDMYYPETDYDAWLVGISGSNISYSPMNMAGLSGSSPVIILAKPLVSLRLESTGAYLCIVIDSDVFLKLFEKYSDGSAFSFFIIDAENRVLCRSSAASGVSDIPEYSMLDKSGNIYEKGGLFCAYSTSDVTSWKYLSIAPMRVVLAKSYRMLIVDICILVLSILVFIIACGYFLRKNYNPISSIISLIGKKGNAEIGNEYDYIKNAISEAFSENRALSTQLEKQNMALRDNFLQNLLKGASSLPEESLENLGIHFDHDCYVVLIYYIDDCTDLFFDEHSAAGENAALAGTIIRNIIPELMAEYGTGYVFEADGMLTGIFNAETEELCTRAMREVSKKAQRFCTDNFNLYFSVAQSGVCRSLSHIFAAYKEALDVLEYKVVMCNCENLTISDLKSHTKYEYNYSLALEQQLIDSIKLGDFARVSDTVDKIFEVSFEQSNPPLSIIRCLIFNIIGTMIKAISELSLIYKEDFADSYVAADKLLQCRSVAELKDELYRMLSALCGLVSSKKSVGEEGIEKKIISFVEKNYADHSLGVAMVAEHFGLSVNYVSAVFKQKMNIGLLEYINNIRVEKSIEFLKDKSLKINDIANMVGYSVPRTFLNIFKKVTGLTPSQYRELNT